MKKSNWTWNDNYTCAGSQANIKNVDLRGGGGVDECWEDAPAAKVPV